jgi:hypothetical protein
MRADVSPRQARSYTARPGCGTARSKHYRELAVKRVVDSSGSQAWLLPLAAKFRQCVEPAQPIESQGLIARNRYAASSAT